MKMMLPTHEKIFLLSKTLQHELLEGGRKEELCGVVSERKIDRKKASIHEYTASLKHDLRFKKQGRGSVPREGEEEGITCDVVFQKKKKEEDEMLLLCASHFVKEQETA